MAIERTFSIIKPDATRRNLTGKINAVIEGAGLAAVVLTIGGFFIHKAVRFFEEQDKLSLEDRQEDEDHHG